MLSLSREQSNFRGLKNLRGQSQGLQNVSSRTSSRLRTSSRTPPLVRNCSHCCFCACLNITQDIMRYFMAKLQKSKFLCCNEIENVQFQVVARTASRNDKRTKLHVFWFYKKHKDYCQNLQHGYLVFKTKTVYLSFLKKEMLQMDLIQL